MRIKQSPNAMDLDRLFGLSRLRRLKRQNLNMASKIHVDAGLALPDGWEEHQHALIEDFFNEKVPAALQEKEIQEPGFKSKGCSATNCLEYAKFLMQGMPISLDIDQGLNSYTLTCPGRDRIIQFRTNELNIKAINEARRTYGDLIPRTIRHHDFVLPVYTYNILPGHLHAWRHVARDPFPLEREKRTITDLAKFIATATHFPHSKDRYSDDSWTISANATLQRLEQNLSRRQMAPDLHTRITSLKTKLHLLHTLPPVLTHPDLTSPNIFIQKDTGLLTGVLNSSSTRTEAFGTNIYALYEKYLGSMQDGHWSPYDMPAGESHPGQTVIEVLRGAFWDSLWGNAAAGLRREVDGEAVGVAVRVGVVNRYLEGMGDESERDSEEGVRVISVNYAREIWRYLDESGV